MLRRFLIKKTKCPKWNKVYKLVNVAIAGNGHRLKAWIIDVYTGKEFVCCLQDLEIVKRD